MTYPAFHNQFVLQLSELVKPFQNFGFFFYEMADNNKNTNEISIMIKYDG